MSPRIAFCCSMLLVWGLGSGCTQAPPSTPPPPTAANDPPPSQSDPIVVEPDAPLSPPEIDPLLQQAFDEFVAGPDERSYLLIRQLLLNHAEFTPQDAKLESIAALVRDGDNRAVIQAVYQQYPTVMLSPQAHLYASLAADRLLDDDPSLVEMKAIRDEHGLLAIACLRGLQSTGNGSPETPYLICLREDMEDLLSFLEKPVQSQRLEQQGERVFAVIFTLEAEHIWFDVTDVLRRMDANAPPG